MENGSRLTFRTFMIPRPDPAWGIFSFFFAGFFRISGLEGFLCSISSVAGNSGPSVLSEFSQKVSRPRA